MGDGRPPKLVHFRLVGPPIFRPEVTDQILLPLPANHTPASHFSPEVGSNSLFLRCRIDTPAAVATSPKRATHGRGLADLGSSLGAAELPSL
jgi:hypothetical protein